VTKKVFAGIFLLTLAVLMLELALTRLFSATMYYHFAFMAISLALFGGGASGVFIYVIQAKLKERDTGNLMGLCALLFAVSVIFALFVVIGNPITLDNAAENYLRLIKIYCATAMPFFFAGCAVTLAITRFAGDINRLYLFDLAGAALGCFLLIPLLNLLGAINLVVWIGVIGTASAILFSASAPNKRIFIPSLLAFVALAGFASYDAVTKVTDLKIAKGKDQAKNLFSKWNSFSRITVDGDLNGIVDIKIDSDASTLIVPDGRNTEKHQDLRKSIVTFAYNIKPGAHAAIIGPGGGTEVASALVFGAKRITAIEINPIIAQDVMLTEPFRSYSGDLYGHPIVDLHFDEGRSFIRRSTDRYDILQASLVDTWAATGAGAFSLSENNLYTVEAFKDYVLHLTDDGVFTMTRWFLDPPDQSLRLVSLSRAMMTELQIGNPERHFFIVKDTIAGVPQSHATFLFKKSEFTDTEVKTLESVAAENNFEIIYSPLTRPDNVFTRMITAEDPAAIWDAYNTNVFPTHDNNPFFFNSLRVSNLGQLIGSDAEWKKTNIGTLVLFSLFAITSVMVVLFILGPLIAVRNRATTGDPTGRMPFLFYFGCLGAGFIVVEIAMIQKFILFLGHPVYSLAVILFSLLTFSAIGSYVSRVFVETQLLGTLTKILILVAVITGIYLLVLPPIFYGLVWLSLTVRIVIAVVLMAPLAFVMGMPLPIGIRLMAARSPQIIPWAWGVNGAASVMGSVATLVIAILTGFNQALIVGACVYLLAALLVKFRIKAEISPV